MRNEYGNMKQIKAIIFDWGDTLMKDFSEYSGPMIDWPRVEVMSGVAETLEQLSQQYLCCVASNAGDSNAELMGMALERAGIKKYFQALFTSKELGYKKPHVEFFTAICKGLDLPSDQCLMVGNDYGKDIVPAKDGSLSTVLVNYDLNCDVFPKADYIIRSMNDLIPILNNGLQ